MPGRSRWILALPATDSVIDSALEVDTLLRVMLVADHFGVDAGQVEVSGLIFAAARDDHFSLCGFAEQGLHDRFLR